MGRKNRYGNSKTLWRVLRSACVYRKRGRKTVRIVKNYGGSTILRLQVPYYFEYGRVFWECTRTQTNTDFRLSAKGPKTQVNACKRRQTRTNAQSKNYTPFYAPPLTQKNSRRLRDGETTIKIKFSLFGGGGLGGREEDRPNAVFRSKRHDNKILKVQILLSRSHCAGS